MKPRQSTSGMAGLLGCAIGALIGGFWFSPYLTWFVGSIVGAVLFGIIFNEADRWVREGENDD